MSAQRRLAAILFTDILGSTAVTARSEAAGLAQRDRHRRVVRAAVEAHHGRLIEAPGDASLSTFTSALDAVHAALAIQRAVDADEGLDLHIGVHLGEIVVRGPGEVFGDGVNLAARICALSDGSAPYVSDEIRHAVQNQTHLRCESLGAQTFKNVSRPVEVHRLLGEARPPRREPLLRRLGVRRPGRWLATAGLLAALLLAVWWSARAPPVEPIRSLAVLPLENLSGDPAQEYFADGMTETLIADLGRIDGLRVISRTSVMRYKGGRKPLPEIAAELGVDALLEGTVMHEGERVRVTAQLIDGRSDHQLWSERYDRDLREVLALQSDVARAVARSVMLELLPGAAQLPAPPVDPAAHDALLRGIYQYGRFTPESLGGALESFQRAIELDPGYALAHAWLAGTWMALSVELPVLPQHEAMPRARDAAIHALELDEATADAHVVRAVVALNFDWDWPLAERHLARALELNPSLASAHGVSAFYLASLARHEQAVAQAQLALELAPLDVSLRTKVSGIYVLVRRFGDALAEERRIREIDPAFGYNWAGTALHALGRYGEMIDAYERWLFTPEQAAALRVALGRDGPAGVWREALRALRAAPATAHWPLAALHAQLGERDAAFAELESAYLARENSLAFLRVQFQLDPIRDDPRFAELVRRIGIPEG